MKQTVTKSDFRDAFQRMDRGEQFSYEGLGALFDWYEDLDDNCGIETELDVIAICCDWCEYDSLKEISANYQDITSLDDLRDYTTVIELSTGLLIQNY